jgi:hypothetical protein
MKDWLIEVMQGSKMRSWPVLDRHYFLIAQSRTPSMRHSLNPSFPQSLGQEATWEARRRREWRTGATGYPRGGPPKTQNEPKKCCRINKRSEKRTQNEPKTNPNETREKPFNSFGIRVRLFRVGKANQNEPKTNPSPLHRHASLQVI